MRYDYPKPIEFMVMEPKRKNYSRDVMLIHVSQDRNAEWASALAKALPGLEIRVWPEVGDPNEISLTLIWKPPTELFSMVRKIDVIFSIGAGVDHLIRCPTIPEDVPIVRMIDAQLTAGMVEYVLYHVLRIHRNMDRYIKQKREGTWGVLPYKPASEICVGVMGMGELGSAVSTSLSALGYRVQGWSRTLKLLPDVQSFVGMNELSSFLEGTNILVLLLPLTNATKGIIDLDRLMELPIGSHVVNPGRGLLIVENDLLTALRVGRIAGVALDVFPEEPLPSTHQFWKHENVFVTPHIASLTNPVTAAQSIADNIKRRQEGKVMRGVVDIENYR